MTTRLRMRATLLSALLLLNSGAAAQSFELITDPEAYAVYGVVLPKRDGPDGPLFVQSETAGAFSSCDDVMPIDVDWRPVVESYRTENLRVRLIQFNPPVPSYSIRGRAELQAEHKRRSAKLPGFSAGGAHYATVSAVGFNGTKTRAMVSVSLGFSVHLYKLEKRDGAWVSLGPVCSLIV